MDLFLNGKRISQAALAKNRSSHRSVQRNGRRNSSSDAHGQYRRKQLAVLPAQAALRVLDDMENFRNGFLSDEWCFKVSPEIADPIKSYTSSEKETLIKTLKDAGYLDGRVSNQMDDIRSVTSDDFQVDEDIQRVATENALYCWFLIDIQLPKASWKHLGPYFEGSESRLRFNLPPPALSDTKETTVFTSLCEKFMGPSADTSRPVTLRSDGWGHVVGAYTLPFGEGLTLEISFTDLTSFSQESQLGRPSPAEIVNAHNDRTNLQDLTQYRGYVVLPFRVPIDNDALPLLGATRGARQIVGVQTQGHLQINKKTACNFKMEAVVVEVTRSGGSSSRQEGHYEFFQREGWQVFCHILVQVKINGQLVFYTTYTHDDKDR